MTTPRNIFTNRKITRLALLAALLCVVSVSFSQEKKKVEILRAGSLKSSENIAENAQRLIDSVLIRHKNILMWADSAYTYPGNRVDAFGNVHIKQDDTLHLYANTVYYDGDKQFAQAWGKVRLVNKSTTIYTDTLDYDLEKNISYYDDFGRIVDSATTITSIIGKYMIDQNLLYFYRDVVAVNDNKTLESDTVVYNTETSRVLINGPTTIRDSSTTLYAENGWYNTDTGEAELLENPEISNPTQNVKANYIKYNKQSENARAIGNVRILDAENQSLIRGNLAVYSDLLETATVTDSAVYINFTETDTLFLHADTLRAVPDTIEGERVISAYYGVRFFKTDLQGICDSMIYYTKDSVVQLHNNPVVWSDNQQLSADLIELQQLTDAPDQLHLTNNSFIVSKQDSGRFDQIKGKNMTGYIVNEQLSNIEVDGSGQTLYYARNKEQIIGLNRAESSRISIRFKTGKIDRISFLKAPEGELKPLLELTEEEKTLKGFDWKIYLRPLSKHDIFEKEKPATEQPE